MEQITGPMELLPLATEGGGYLLPKVKLKYWPLVHNLQPLVFAGIELREQLNGREPIELQIATCANAKRESGSEPAKWDPRTRETADHSAPYILAHVLRHGTIDHDAFEPEAYLDESLRPLMSRMTVVADDEIEAVYPDTIRLRVTATDTAGQHYDVEIANPLGHEKNPMVKADIDAKFTRNAAALLPANRIAEALRIWWSIGDRPVAAAPRPARRRGRRTPARRGARAALGQAESNGGGNVMTTVTALAANGVLGSGYLAETFQAGLDAGADFIGCDAGSTDPGPYFLGAGVTKAPEGAVKNDLRPMLRAAVERRIPVLIGSAGQAGARPHLAWTARVVREVAAEIGLHFPMALIDSEQDKDVLHEALRQGRISPLGVSPALTADQIERSTHIVAQMGSEPFEEALRHGAQVVIAGRATDTAIFAAVPRMRGLPGGPTWHAAKVLECGASCVENRPHGDSMVAHISADDFVMWPPNHNMRCTAQSVAAHTLYENADPFHLIEPSGVLDTSAARYALEPDGRSVRVTGSTFVEKEHYDVKLEGAAPVGYRTIAIGGIRDPLVIGQLDSFLDGSVAAIRKKVANGMGLSEQDYLLSFRVYGRDACLGPLEPLRSAPVHEVGLLIEVVADSQERRTRHLHPGAPHDPASPNPGVVGSDQQSRVPVLAAKRRRRRRIRVHAQPRHAHRRSAGCGAHQLRRRLSGAAQPAPTMGLLVRSRTKPEL